MTRLHWSRDGKAAVPSGRVVGFGRELPPRVEAEKRRYYPEGESAHLSGSVVVYPEFGGGWDDKARA